MYLWYLLNYDLNSFLYCSTIFPGNALYLFHCHKWFRHDWRFVIIPDDHFLIVVSVLLSDAAVWLEISIRMKAGAMTIMVLIVKKKRSIDRWCGSHGIDAQDYHWKNKNVQHVICMFPWQMCLWLWTVWKWNYGPICQPIKKWDAKNTDYITCWIDTNSWPTNPDQILDSNYLKSLFKTLHFNNKQKICEMFGSNAWSELSPERPEKTKQKRTKSDFFKENKMEDLTCYVNHNSICTLLFFSCYPPSRSYSPVRFGNDRFIFVWTYVFLIILRPPLF